MTPKTLQELFSVPERWTKGAASKNRYGITVNSTNEEACCWCLMGGILLVDSSRGQMQSLKKVITSKFPNRCSGILHPIANFNDHPDTTIQDIQLVCKEANV